MKRCGGGGGGLEAKWYAETVAAATRILDDGMKTDQDQLRYTKGQRYAQCVRTRRETGDEKQRKSKRRERTTYLSSCAHPCSPSLIIRGDVRCLASVDNRSQPEWITNIGPHAKFESSVINRDGGGTFECALILFERLGARKGSAHAPGGCGRLRRLSG